MCISTQGIRSLMTLSLMTLKPTPMYKPFWDMADTMLQHYYKVWINLCVYTQTKNKCTLLSRPPYLKKAHRTLSWCVILQWPCTLLSRPPYLKKAYRTLSWCVILQWPCTLLSRPPYLKMAYRTLSRCVFLQWPPWLNVCGPISINVLTFGKNDGLISSWKRTGVSLLF